MEYEKSAVDGCKDTPTEEVKPQNESTVDNEETADTHCEIDGIIGTEETDASLEADNSTAPAEEEYTAADSATEISELSSITQKICEIETMSKKTAAEMREIHKLLHEEFAGRLKNMQEELDKYHEIDKGRIYDNILTEIAKLYGDNENLIETLNNKQLTYMFMDLMQILEVNGVRVQKSKTGDKRNTRHCQVIEQIETDDRDKHDTVAKSMNTGFYLENRTLVKERVHVNVYKEQ